MINLKSDFWKGTIQIALGIYIAGVALIASLIAFAWVLDMVRPFRD